MKLKMSCVAAVLFAICTNPIFATNIAVRFDEDANGNATGTFRGFAHNSSLVEQNFFEAASVQAVFSPFLGDNCNPRCAVVLFEPQLGVPPELSLVSDVVTQDFLGHFPDQEGDWIGYRWQFYSGPLAALVDLTSYSVAFVAESAENVCNASNIFCEGAPDGFFDLTHAMGNSASDSVHVEVRSEITTIPEPATLALLGLGFAALGLSSRDPTKIRTSARR